MALDGCRITLKIMDGFTYTNLFETKGIEYLVVIAFLLSIIPFWLLINRPVKVKAALRRVIGVLTPGVLRIPRGLFYTRNHTWTFMEQSGSVRVGLDDLLLHITGNVEPVEHRNTGEMVKRGEPIAELVQDGKHLKILSPISGKIVSRNDLLETDPGLMNSDPYGKGWLYKILPDDWVGETKSSLIGEEAANWLASEVTRFKDFMAASVSRHLPEPSLVTLQDGGEIIDNVLSEMPVEIWSEFEKDFLNITVE